MTASPDFPGPSGPEDAPVDASLTPADAGSMIESVPGRGHRLISIPVTLSTLIAIAALATFNNLYQPVDGRVIDRYLSNDYCLGIFTLFVAATSYALLQAMGLRLDRRQALTGRTGGIRLLRAATGRSRATSVDRTHVDHALALLGYVAWALPLLGFIGTVIGISAAIGDLGGIVESGDSALANVIGGLEFAFDTTLAGLVTVIPVMLYTYPLRIWADRITDVRAPVS